MARARVEESVAQIAREIRVEIERDKAREIHRRIDYFAHDACNYAKDISPEPPGDWPQTPTTGAYKEAWHVERRPGPRGPHGGRGLPQFAIVNDDPVAAWVEYGTGPDSPGTRSTWGPNTPTRAQAIAARTAMRFGRHTRL